MSLANAKPRMLDIHAFCEVRQDSQVQPFAVGIDLHRRVKRYKEDSARVENL